jgi:hypothetical protein
MSIKKGKDRRAHWSPRLLSELERTHINDFRKGFWNGMMKGEKIRSHRKGFLKLKHLSPLKLLISPLFEETFWAFLFLFLFFSSISWGLKGFDDIWGENHFIKNFISNDFNILVVDAYSGMELCTPTWLNHDYGDAGVMDILVVDVYSKVDVYTPIFMGEASNKCGWQIIFKKFQNSDGHIP